ncbi:hypothetical protein ABG067_003991 [Albugo candida]|uniref:J domain-containing protein n=1 Tax=Albugo candida TaxID=65357 RepID=A0A024GGF5_9STRA|nr:unnamed protein product [Albugo candida]|eukprot:CCI45942.1 unnamed protein product [Albugo candida]
MTTSSPATDALWAFYYIQGEDGEDRSHPNAFKVPYSGSSDITLADIHRHFPLKNPSEFHFRFRLNTVVRGTPISDHNGKTASSNKHTFFWLDITSTKQKVPLSNGRIICKLLRLQKPQRIGLIFQRKPVSIQTRIQKDQAVKIRCSHANASELDMRTSDYTEAEGGGAYGHPGTPHKEYQASAKRNENTNQQSSTNKVPVEQKAEKSRTSNESFEDFLSGGGPGKPTRGAGIDGNNVNLMIDHAWNQEGSAANMPRSSTSPNFLNSMDPLTQKKTPQTINAASSKTQAPPAFDDDGGQTVGPVTLAEMRKYATSTSDGSNVYNPSLIDKSTKSEFVRRAMEERERKMNEEITKARQALQQREEAQRLISTQKEQAYVMIGPKLKAWAEDNGRIKNIRTLLSTMHLVMWENSKWQEVNMGKLIQPQDVKKVYRKAMIVVHPDKSRGCNAEELLIAERVFAAVNTAWEEFITTNPCQ